MLQKRPYPRAARIAPSLQQGLTKILGSYYPVPHGGLLTVSEVELSRDLSFAKIFISVLYFHQSENQSENRNRENRDEDDQGENNQCKLREYLSELNKHVPRIRHLLTTEIKLKYIPNLLFAHDEVPAEAEKINRLLQKSV